MELTKEWLKQRNIDYTMTADGKIMVGGSLYLSGTGITALPEGLHVGGSLDLSGTGITALPEGITAEEIIFDGEINGHKFMIVDGICCVVVAEKIRDGITIKSCRRSEFKDGKLTGERMFVVSHGEHNAHGKTLDEAMADIAFKTADRDVSKYRGMEKTTSKTPQEWATIYRIITGACRYGTQSFMDAQGKLKKTYTLSEIIERTRGAYGSERFREVVEN